MPAQRELTMRQIRQMLRLAHDGVSAREIGRRLGIARSTVHDNIGRAAAAGLSWPLGEEITDAVLEQRLFSHIGVKQGIRRRSEPDWSSLAREKRRPWVNLTVLWKEYRQAHPERYGYSRFCDLYREFERRLTPVMRQHHAAGDKVFVDYSGKRVPIVDPVTGVVREAETIVAVHLSLFHDAIAEDFADCDRSRGPEPSKDRRRTSKPADLGNVRTFA